LTAARGSIKNRLAVIISRKKTATLFGLKTATVFFFWLANNVASIVWFVVDFDEKWWDREVLKRSGIELASAFVEWSVVWLLITRIDDVLLIFLMSFDFDLAN
jgi:hypothetical protein